MRTPMRPASGFLPFTPDVKKASWEELARERESDGETKNYSVPPELIELARANRKARGQVGTLTPLAPKPTQEVVVVVPATAPVAPDMRSGEPDPASSLQAPSVPLDGASSDPESARTVVAAVGYAAATKPSAPPSAAPPALPLSPLAEMMRTELAVARGAAPPAQAAPSEAPRVEAGPSEALLVDTSASESTGVRRSSRRARRSLRIETDNEASAAARAAAIEPVRAKSYMPVLFGAGIVGAYIVLCYYANALLAGLP